MSKIAIRPINSNDREWVSQFITEHWGSNKVVSRGVIYYPQDLPGFVAIHEGEKVGLVTYNIIGASCEIVTIDSIRPSSGVGTALIEAAREVALQCGCKRLWLITTNDNLNALRFYQKRGFMLVAIYRNALEVSRRLKPGISLIGYDGIPLRDEIELEMLLADQGSYPHLPPLSLARSPEKEKRMSTSNTLTTDFTIRLHDGRTMGVASVGRSDGFPILHCHGSGSSRLEVNLLAAAAATQGVRLIGLDRPGIGRSDPKTGYRLLDWPDDVVEVADRLGIERFAVEGISAGGPYALACAYKIPHRLTACGLMSTVSPGNLIRRAGPGWMRIMWSMGGQFPWFLRLYARLVQRLTGSDEASIEKYLVRYAAQLGAADQKLLSNPEIRGPLVQAMAESFRQGGEGNLEVVLAEVRPWGFQVEQIAFEKLFLWHGEQDRVMPIAPARLLSQALPHCTAIFYPDEGHFSTVANHAQDILHQLRVQYSPAEALTQDDAMEEGQI